MGESQDVENLVKVFKVLTTKDDEERDDSTGNVAVGYEKIMTDLKAGIGECFKELLKHKDFTTKTVNDGILSLCKEDGSEEENFTSVYIVNPLEYAWKLHKLYMERMPHKVTVLFIGMNPALSAPSGIPFDDGGKLWEFLKINKSETNITIPEEIRTPKKCRSAENFWRVITEKFEEEYREHCFVINFSPLLYVGSNGKNDISLEGLESRVKKIVKPLTEKCQEALVMAIKLMSPELIVGMGGYAQKRIKAAIKTINAAKTTNATKTTKITMLPVAHPRIWQDEWIPEVKKMLHVRRGETIDQNHHKS